jgi:hypothetical protein
MYPIVHVLVIIQVCVGYSELTLTYHAFVFSNSWSLQLNKKNTFFCTLACIWVLKYRNCFVVNFLILFLRHDGQIFFIIIENN